VFLYYWYIFDKVRTVLSSKVTIANLPVMKLKICSSCFHLPPLMQILILNLTGGSEGKYFIYKGERIPGEKQEKL